MTTERRNLIAEALDEQDMNLFLRVHAAFARGELPNPCTWSEFLRVADDKGWPIKPDVRAWAVREGILETPEAVEPLPWEMPVTPAARTAPAREAKGANAKRRRESMIAEWKALRDRQSPPSKTECARRVTGKQEPRALIDALKKQGLW